MNTTNDDDNELGGTGTRGLGSLRLDDNTTGGRVTSGTARVQGTTSDGQPFDEEIQLPKGQSMPVGPLSVLSSLTLKYHVTEPAGEFPMDPPMGLAMEGLPLAAEQVPDIFIASCADAPDPMMGNVAVDWTPGTSA